MAGPSEPDLDSLFADPDAAEWMKTHLAELRSSVAEHRFRKQLVWMGVLVGLVAHIGGYLVRASAPAEPLGLVADLLYSLGLALWTGTVVVVLVEIVPQAKERQILNAIDHYEATVRNGPPGRDRGGKGSA
jgi:hypothetical protein